MVNGLMVNSINKGTVKGGLLLIRSYAKIERNASVAKRVSLKRILEQAKGGFFELWREQFKDLGFCNF